MTIITHPECTETRRGFTSEPTHAEDPQGPQTTRQTYSKMELRGQKLGKILCKLQMVTPEQLEAGLEHARAWDQQLGRSLVTLGFCTENTIVRARSIKFGLPSGRMAAAEPEAEILAIVEGKTAQRLNVLPLAVTHHRGRTLLHVAMSSPEDMDAVRELEFATGMKVSVVLAGDSELKAAVLRFYTDDYAHLPGIENSYVELEEREDEEPSLELTEGLPAEFPDQPTLDFPRETPEKKADTAQNSRRNVTKNT